MADDFYDLAELAKINDKNLAELDLSDLLQSAPLFATLPAVISSNGESHKYNKLTTAPVVGFRAENAGRDFDHSIRTTVTRTLKILDGSFQIDKAVADGYRGGAQAAIQLELEEHLRSLFFAIEKQLIVGTTDGDANGFDGLADEATLDALADAYTVDAGGTTANTASSCYLINANPSSGAVATVLPENGGFDVGETIVQNASSANFPVYYTPMSSLIGMQFGSNYAAVRIVNLTADSGKGLTDALIYSALEIFPSDRQPTHCVMSRRSLEQLRASRTATNQTGAPAPRPTEVAEGIPIIVTDGQIDTEALIT